MLVRSAFIGLLMALVAVTVASLNQSVADVVSVPALDGLLPGDFGDWQEVELNAAVLPAEVDLSPGEAVAYRAYRDSVGHLVTLVIAYGPPLGDSVRLHRPEICYAAQGFSIRERRVDMIHFGSTNAAIIRMRTENSLKSEDVSYWLRDGENFVTNARSAQLFNFNRHSSGSADNVLVRISTNGNHASPFTLHDRFFTEFVAALSNEARTLFIAGAP